MKIPVLLLVLTGLSTMAGAQSISSSVINASGNSFTQGYYSLDWSVGEMSLVESMIASNSSAVITNGFLQPFKPAENTVQQFSSEEIRILPNPTYNKIEINFLTVQQGDVYIQISDALGKIISSRKTVSYGIGSIEKFNLAPFSAGTYFIRIDLDPAPGSVRKTGTYKILKLS
jgi:hypothetical protein